MPVLSQQVDHAGLLNLLRVMAAVSLLLAMECLSQSPEPQGAAAFGGINLQSSHGVLDLSSPTVIAAGHYVIGGFYTSSSRKSSSLSGMTGSLGFGLAKYSQLNFSYSSVGDNRSDYRYLTLSLKGNLLQETVPLSIELTGSRIEILSQTDSLSVESAEILRLIGSTEGIGSSRIYFHAGYILMSRGLPKRSRFLAGTGMTLPVTRTLGLGAEIQASERPTDAGGIKGGIGLKWLANSHVQITLGIHATSFSGRVSNSVSLGLHVSSEMLQENMSPVFETEDSLLIPPPLEDLQADSTLHKTNLKDGNESFLQLRDERRSHDPSCLAFLNATGLRSCTQWLADVGSGILLQHANSILGLKHGGCAQAGTRKGQNPYENSEA